jgi:hypothetical protein
MNNLALLVACFAIGVLLRRSGRLPENVPPTLDYGAARRACGRAPKGRSGEEQGR